MPRGKRPMAWMKLHGTFLDSSINYEMNLEQQCVFIKMCLFSLRCGEKPGTISDNDGKPMPIWYIANSIKVPEELVEQTIIIGTQTNRINKNGNGIIEIVNWKHYQSEYERQKPYRDAKKIDSTDPDKFIKGKRGHLVKR